MSFNKIISHIHKMISDIFSNIFNFVLPYKDNSRVSRSFDSEHFLSLIKPTQKDGNIYLLSYRDTNGIKAVIHSFKYEKSKHSLLIIRDLFIEGINIIYEDLSLFYPKSDLIITPIPQNNESINDRRYNQFIFLKPYLLESGITYKELLALNKKTMRQSKLNKANRTKNIKDAYKVISDVDLSNKVIIVIDDIMTTGATLKEAKRTLKQYGCKNIKTLAICH